MSVVDWPALLADDGLELEPPASDLEVAKVEAVLGATLPPSLLGLYLVTNGVHDKDGEWFAVWTLARVVERNQEEWANEDTARQHLLGFGDDCTGAAFCVQRDGSNGVFTWQPIEQLAYRLADTVEEFWYGWLRGEITT